MGDYVYQEYPKVKYHPKHAPRTVQNIEEEQALGRLWGNSPDEFPKPSRITAALREDVKSWWDEWDWGFKATASILRIIVILATSNHHWGCLSDDALGIRNPPTIGAVAAGKDDGPT